MINEQIEVNDEVEVDKKDKLSTAGVLKMIIWFSLSVIFIGAFGFIFAWNAQGHDMDLWITGTGSGLAGTLSVIMMYLGFTVKKRELAKLKAVTKEDKKLLNDEKAQAKINKKAIKKEKKVAKKEAVMVASELKEAENLVREIKPQEHVIARSKSTHEVEKAPVTKKVVVARGKKAHSTHKKVSPKHKIHKHHKRHSRDVAHNNVVFVGKNLREVRAHNALPSQTKRAMADHKARVQRAH